MYRDSLQGQGQGTEGNLSGFLWWWRRQQQRQRSSGHGGGKKVFAPSWNIRRSMRIDHRLVSRMYQNRVFLFIASRVVNVLFFVQCFDMLDPILSDSCVKYIQIHMVDTWRWHTVLGNPKPFIHTNHLKWVDQRGLCIVVCITYGIDVFLLACNGAWYRLAKYIMIHEWGWSTRGPLFSRHRLNSVHGDMVIHGSHMNHIWITYNMLQLVGYVPKYITIHDQIHVSVRGDTRPNSRGIQTMPW